MSKYDGMTVNERLFVAGLLANFDQAFAAMDRDAMIRVLLAVDLSEDQAQQTTDACLSNPEKYRLRRTAPS